MQPDQVQQSSNSYDPFALGRALSDQGVAVATSVTTALGRGAAGAGDGAAAIGREALGIGGSALGAAGLVLTTQSPAGESSSGIRDHANPPELNFAAHPPVNPTTVTPNQSGLHGSIVGSQTPAHSAPATANHTGHSSTPPATEPIHTTPNDAAAAKGSTTTTPVHQPSAADQMLEARQLKPVGPNHQGEFNGTADSAFTIERASQLQGQIGASAKFGTTMGVATAADSDGNSYVLVSSNELRKDGSPQFRKGVTLNQGEIPVGGNPRAPNHDAETNVSQYATDHGLTIRDIASTRPMCSDCETAVLDQNPNAHISSPRTGQPSVSRQ